MISFTKVRLEWGWLGNMAPFPIVHDKYGFFKTTEALFQAMRFHHDHPVVDLIRGERSPMGAKLKAKANADEMVVAQLSQRDVDNMREVLKLKVESHPELKDKLIATGEHTIIEDVTSRQRGSAMFWGAALTNGDESRSKHWIGDNWLGVCWGELRNDLNGIEYEPKRVPSITDLLEKNAFKSVIIGGLKSALSAHGPKIDKHNLESAAKRIGGFVRGHLARYTQEELLAHLLATEKAKLDAEKERLGNKGND